MAVSNVSRGATSELPHANDIRELTNRSLYERDDYKSAMSKVRAAIQAQAAKGLPEARVRFHDTEGTVARAVQRELSVAGYDTELEAYLRPPSRYYLLDISW